MATAHAGELGAEQKLREFVHGVYDELQRDVERAKSACERQETQYRESLRGEMAYACDVLQPLLTGALLGARPAPVLQTITGASVQPEQSRRRQLQDRERELEALLPPITTAELDGLSMRDLADMVLEDTFPMNSRAALDEAPRRELPAAPRRADPGVRQVAVHARPAGGLPRQRGPAAGNSVCVQVQVGPDSGAPRQRVVLRTNQAASTHTARFRTEGPPPPRTAFQSPRDIPEPRDLRPPRRVPGTDPGSRPASQPASDSPAPVLTKRVRSTTQVLGTPESVTRITRTATDKEINVPGTGLRVTVSRSKQTLSRTHSSGTRIALDQRDVLIKKMLVPGGHADPSLIRQNVTGGDLDPGVFQEDGAQFQPMSKIQMGNMSEEWLAAQKHLRECKSCSRSLNPLLRKVGTKLVNLPCTASSGQRLQVAPGDTNVVRHDFAAGLTASCKLLCWDPERLSGLSAEQLRAEALWAPGAPALDESCDPFCWVAGGVSPPQPPPEHGPVGQFPARPAPPHLVHPQPAVPHPPRPQPATPHPARPQPAAPHPVRPQPAAPHPVRPQPAAPHPVRPQPAAPHPVRPQPAAPHPVRPQPTAPLAVRPQPAAAREFRQDQDSTQMPPASLVYKDLLPMFGYRGINTLEKPDAQRQPFYCCKDCDCTLTPDARRGPVPQQPPARPQAPPAQPDDVSSTFSSRPFSATASPMFQRYSSVEAERQKEEELFNCCDECKCTSTDHDKAVARQVKMQHERSIPGIARTKTIPRSKEPAAEDILSHPEEEAVYEVDLTPTQLYDEGDDECVLEPYVDRFQFTDEQLNKAFPEAVQVTAAASPTPTAAGLFLKERVESIVSRRQMRIVGNMNQKTWHVKKQSKTKSIQHTSLSPRTQISETSSTFLNCGEIKRDAKDLNFFQVTTKSKDCRSQMIRLRQDQQVETILSADATREDPLESRTDMEIKDDEMPKTPTLEFGSCHLLCWDKSQDTHEIAPHPKVHPLLKDDDSCMVLCWDDTPTEEAKSMVDISRPGMHKTHTDDASSEGSQEVQGSCQLLCWNIGKLDLSEPDVPLPPVRDLSSCAVLCWAKESKSDLSCSLLCLEADLQHLEAELDPVPSLRSSKSCDILCWAGEQEMVRTLGFESKDEPDHDSDDRDDEREKKRKMELDDGSLTLEYEEPVEHILTTEVGEEDILKTEVEEQLFEITVKTELDEEPVKKIQAPADICKDILVDIVHSFPPTAKENVQYIIYQLVSEVTQNSNKILETNNETHAVVESATSHPAQEYNNSGNEPVVFQVMPVSVLAGPGKDSMLLYPMPLNMKTFTGKKFSNQQPKLCEENYKEKIVSAILRKIHSKIVDLQQPVLKTMEMAPTKLVKSDETIISEIVTGLKQLVGNGGVYLGEHQVAVKVSKEKLGIVVEAKQHAQVGKKKVKPGSEQLRTRKHLQASQVEKSCASTKLRLKHTGSVPQPKVSASAAMKMDGQHLVKKPLTPVLMGTDSVSGIQTKIYTEDERKLNLTASRALPIGENLNQSRLRTIEKFGKSKPLKNVVNVCQNKDFIQHERTLLKENETLPAEKLVARSHLTGLTLGYDGAEKKNWKPNRIHNKSMDALPSTKHYHNFIYFPPNAQKPSERDDSKVHFFLHNNSSMDQCCDHTNEPEISETPSRPEQFVNLGKVKNAMESRDLNKCKCNSSTSEIMCCKTCKNSKLTKMESCSSESENSLTYKTAPTELMSPSRNGGKMEQQPSLQNLNDRPIKGETREPSGWRRNEVAMTKGSLCCLQQPNQHAWGEHYKEVEDQGKPDDKILVQSAMQIIPTGLSIILTIGDDSLLLGWDEIEECDSRIAGFEIRVNSELHQRVHSTVRGRALLKNLDLSQNMEISIQCITKAGQKLGTPACIHYKP